MRAYHSPTIFAVLLTVGVSGVDAPRDQALPVAAPAPSFVAPPPRFADPDRSRKLAAAFPEIDRLMQAYAEREHIPGATWGIVIDGQLAHQASVGLRNVATKQPVEADTVFRIASMTKSFTAVAILTLRDAGKLSLDDPAERYVPELRGLTYPTADAPRLTIRHLLSHSTGFPEDNPWGDQQLAVSDAEFTAMLKHGIAFSNAPGIAYEYSNYGFAILGRIVTRASGMPYNDYIARHILQPLGMTATTLEPREVPALKLAHGYRWEDEQWKEEPQLPDGAFGSMGGMLTSMRDLSRYVAMYLDAWPPRDGGPSTPLSRASLREMQQVSRPRPSVVTRDASGATQLNSGGYGYGLGITQTCQLGHIVAHTGGLPGFGSLMRWLPEHGVGIIAFGNRTYSGWGAVGDQAIALLANTGALQPRVVQPSPALIDAKTRVSRLVNAWDDRDADALAAVNLFLDRSKDRRSAEFERLRAEVGTCRAADEFVHVENALRGEWRLACDRGELQAAITLAPTIPPTVQYMEVRAVPAGGLPARRTCQ
ncbi:MAG: beta-lactamase family protein [Acidobacteria bacterium]|nr:beta-lactamase family protein [Acidobacteriota bacterium]